jgi:hypothetical protein
VSGKAMGVGSKTTGLFLGETERPCCLGLIGSENLRVCDKPAGECGTAHQGGSKFEPPAEMTELVYVRDPKY